MKEVEYEFIAEGPLAGDVGEQEMSMNAISLLKQDHAKVQKLLKQVVKAGEKPDPKIVQQIILELQVHATIEEELVYPLLSREDQTGAIESYTEHALVKYIIKEVQPLRRGPELEAKLKVLNELVTAHIKEEEQEFLPEIEKSRMIDLQELGRQMAERKQKLMMQMQRKMSGGMSSGRSVRASSSKKSASVKKSSSPRKGSTKSRSRSTKRKAS